MLALKEVGESISFLEDEDIVTGTIVKVNSISKRYFVDWDDGARTSWVCADSEYIIANEV